ncbi:MAG: tetratricopeptide repeat protein, partial [Caldilineaceae bacterium]|nr:tetratricopeptide repeat protein [Caldilineaceae bacterium]
LWPDYETSQAKRNLRGALYHLRTAIDDFLLISRQTAAIHPTAQVTVDALQFATLLRQAADNEHTLDIALLEEAVPLHQGDFLEGFHVLDAEPFDEWMIGERGRFNHLAIQALNELVVHCANQNRLLRGMDHASHLLRLDPLHEETYRNLMMMLALDGQSSQALARFQEFNNLIWTELGVEPSPVTRQLAERIEAGEFTGQSIQISAPPTRRQFNLPSEVAVFVDRVEIHAQVVDALLQDRSRLVTVTGVGGMGKSRLAVRVAHTILQKVATSVPDNVDTPIRLDGIAFVHLAGIEPGIQSDLHIATAIAGALEIPLTGTDSPVDQLLRALSDRRLLLVLDNFEQLIPAAHFLAALLQAAPDVQLLVTSRSRLNLRGEKVFALDGLPTPSMPPRGEETKPAQLTQYPSTELFLHIAASASPLFTVEEREAEAVVQICRLLHGLPLGIELAATWTRVLDVHEIAGELRQNLDFLTGAMPDLPERHRSLRAVFDQSWRLLSADEQEVLQALAVFRGGFTREAAQTVTGASLLTLASLMDKSLVRREESGESDGQTATRLMIVEVLRQYAEEKLSATKQSRTVHRCHAAYFGDYIFQRQAALESGDQPTALEQMAVELENIRAAVRWITTHFRSEPQVALGIIRQGANGLFNFLDIRGMFAEGAAIFGAAADAADEIAADEMATDEMATDDAAPNLRLRAALQARAGWFAFHLGRLTEADSRLTTSLGLAEAAGAPTELVFSLNYLGALKRHLGELNDATALLTRALVIADAEGDSFGASIALNTLGQVASLRGDDQQAIALLHRSLSHKRRIGDRRGMIYSLTYLGRIAEEKEEYADARGFYSESLQISHELEDPRGIALSQQNLANAALAQGQFSGARRLFQSALAIYRTIGSPADAALMHTHLGEIAAAQHDLTGAAHALGDALDLTAYLPSTPATVSALLGAVDLLIRTERGTEAGQILAAVENQSTLTNRQQRHAAGLAARLQTVRSGAPPLSSDEPVELAALALGVRETLADIARQR